MADEKKTRASRHGYTQKIDGNNLVITVPIDGDTIKAAPDSKTGNSILVATSRGYRTLGLPDGRQIQLSVNVLGDQADYPDRG
jgi:hypothetical protein